MPKQREQNNDRDRYPEQPKKNAAAHVHLLCRADNETWLARLPDIEASSSASSSVWRTGTCWSVCDPRPRSCPGTEATDESWGGGGSPVLPTRPSARG